MSRRDFFWRGAAKRFGRHVHRAARSLIPPDWSLALAGPGNPYGTCLGLEAVASDRRLPAARLGHQRRGGRLELHGDAAAIVVLRRLRIAAGDGLAAIGLEQGAVIERRTGHRATRVVPGRLAEIVVLEGGDHHGAILGLDEVAAAVFGGVPPPAAARP